MTRTIRIKSTDQYGNVAYIYRRRGEIKFRCALADGIPASFSFAGISGDEMGAKFEMEDCETAEDVLIVCERRGSHLHTYEIA